MFQALQDLIADEVLEEDAGSLKEVPKTWWKALTGGKYGGEASEIVEVGVDVFKKGAARGGEAYYHKPKDKANQILKFAEKWIDANPGRKVAGLFVKIDGHPYALINTEAVGSKSSQKFAAVLYHGRPEFRTEYHEKHSRTSGTRRWTSERTNLTQEELGEAMPDGKCDAYLLLADEKRLEKRTARSQSKQNMMVRSAEKNKKEPFYKNKSLEDLEKSASKKLIEKKAGRLMKVAGASVAKKLSDLSQNVQTALDKAMEGETVTIDVSSVRGLENEIAKIANAVSALADLVKEGFIKSKYSWQGGKSYQYERFMRALSELEKN